jgi:hypothetical protein
MTAVTSISKPGFSLARVQSKSRSQAARTLICGPGFSSRAEPTPGETPSYYGVPVLKEPVWIGTIAVYFYFGGLAGMAATLGSTVQLLGGREMHSLVTRTRWIATAGAAISTGLLIQDLGRPERFLHMLRVFKVTSPMSMGLGFSARSRLRRARRQCFPIARGFFVR